ncbi:hypothetical protein QP938_04760 [Porticoccaceae bacterium LTM1]|nr:hypothetical protein QP938_04760 [Porticoccaceae bacterium LTM1]
MCVFELTAILNNYHIPYQVKDKHVLMAMELPAQWIDISQWSRIQLARWLKANRK